MDRLIDYLPEYWKEIKYMIALQDALGDEIQELKANLEDFFKQMFLETATWGLDRWEKMLDLPTNYDLSFENRREIIKAKLRSAGTTTKEMIVSMASAFSGGEVEVIEHNDRYTFEIKFVGTKGIPSNMEAFKGSINSIKPAHLAVEYKYTYTVWKELKSKTWGELKLKNWQDIKVIS